MKKFNFRLEKIRRYKEQLEQDKKMKFAAEQSRWIKERNTLENIIEKRNSYFSKYGVRKPGKLNIIQLLISKRFLDKLARDISEQAKIVAKAQENMNKAQIDLVEASRERKKYEKLKEKYKVLYNKETEREVNKELDEFGARTLKHQLTSSKV